MEHAVSARVCCCCRAGRSVCRPCRRGPCGSSLDRHICSSCRCRRMGEEIRKEVQRERGIWRWRRCKNDEELKNKRKKKSFLYCTVLYSTTTTKSYYTSPIHFDSIEISITLCRTARGEPLRDETPRYTHTYLYIHIQKCKKCSKCKNTKRIKKSM